jgi:3-hydroxymyristoyl/3-hydroxydecanoyl-(acyl carrier protein) dehydratase
MKENIFKYIPQRLPFVMVDSLVFCNKEQTQTEFFIKEDNLFVENGLFLETGILENIAQTCAARLGYLNKNQPVKIGMVGSIDNFELYDLPCAGNKLTTTITVTAEVLNVVVLSASVISDDKLLATCNMKVVLTDIVSES